VNAWTEFVQQEIVLKTLQSQRHTGKHVMLEISFIEKIWTSYKDNDAQQKVLEFISIPNIDDDRNKRRIRLIMQREHRFKAHSKLLICFRESKNRRKVLGWHWTNFELLNWREDAVRNFKLIDESHLLLGHNYPSFTFIPDLSDPSKIAQTITNRRSRIHRFRWTRDF
jgi:hypothetical protein